MLLHRNEVNLTANRTSIIYAHIKIAVLPVAMCVANAEENRTDNQLRLDQSDFSIQNESIIICLSYFTLKHTFKAKYVVTM